MGHKKRVLTIKEASQILRCHPDTLRVACRKGEIPGAIQVGRMWRIPATIGTQPKIILGQDEKSEKSVPSLE